MNEDEKIELARKCFDKGWDFETLKYGDDLYGKEHLAEEVWEYRESLLIMKNELNTCPFCGGKPTVKDLTHGSSLVDMWQASCNNPCATNPAAFGETEEEAINAWNARAPEDSQAFDSLQHTIQSLFNEIEICFQETKTA